MNELWGCRKSREKGSGSRTSGEVQGLEGAMGRNRADPGPQIRALELELVGSCAVTRCMRDWVVQRSRVQTGAGVLGFYPSFSSSPP